MSAPSTLAPRLTLGRIALFGALLLFAAFFLTPLYVMLSTSLKTMDEIRSGTLLSLPMSPVLTDQQINRVIEAVNSFKP